MYIVIKSLIQYGGRLGERGSGGAGVEVRLLSHRSQARARHDSVRRHRLRVLPRQEPRSHPPLSIDAENAHQVIMYIVIPVFVISLNEN